jgi:predicted ATPase with chaperone activity
VRRVALTLVDLNGDERIGAAHLAEALQYRDPDTGTSIAEPARWGAK